MLLRRPITTYMIILAVFIFGGVALSRLSVNLLPEINSPTLLVRTQWQGASAQEVERSVNERLEAILSTVNGVQHIKGVSKQGLSLISLQFGWDTDMNLAFLNTREKLDQVVYTLPQNVERPELIRSNPSDDPIAVLSVTSNNPAANTFNDRMELREWTDQVLTRRLEQIDGVAQAIMVGEVQPEVQIRFNPAKIDRYGLSIDKINNAIRQANYFSNPGQLQDGWYRYSLKINSRLQSLDQIRHLPIATVGQTRIIHLNDVASVNLGEHDPTSFSMLDRQPILTVLVKKDFGSNTVRVFNKIKPVLASLQKEYPDIHTAVLTETASTISNTISNLLQTLLVGGILAFVILFVYLRDPRLPLTIGVSIPISIFLTFLVMYLANIQLNIISLSGLTLGIGLLVDNSIVVLENVQRHQKLGKKLMLAADVGTREIALAVTASTLTTISVFLPLIFLGGFEGVFFRDQALTLSISLLASLVVALLILPVLVANLKHKEFKPQWEQDYGFVVRIQNGYERGMQFFLDHPGWGIAVFLAGLILALTGFYVIPKNVMPELPVKRLEYRVILPENTSLLTSRFVAGQMIQNLDAGSHTKNVLAIGGYTDQTNLAELSQEGLNRFRLEIPVSNVRQEHHAEMQVSRWQHDHPNWEVQAMQTNSPFRSLLNFDSTPLELEFVGKNRQQSAILAQQFDKEARRQFPGWEMQPEHDRQQRLWAITFKEGTLLNLGLNQNQVISYLQSLSTGDEVTQWNHKQDRIQVRLFSKHESYARLTSLTLPAQGRMIPLGEIAHITSITEPEQLVRMDQTPVLTYKTNEGLVNWWWNGSDIDQFINHFKQAHATRIIPTGLALELQSLLHQMGLLLLLSVIVIYIILASQYESLIYPFIILFSIPFAWIGSIILLWIFGLSLNIFSFLGLLVLTGIAVNDAILKVDFMKRYYEETGNLREAIIQAGQNRFRPVVMTTLTTILGLLPMAIPWGTGYAYRQSLGISLMGGMITSTLLTLFLIPVIFMWVQRGWEKLSSRE